MPKPPCRFVATAASVFALVACADVRRPFEHAEDAGRADAGLGGDDATVDEYSDIDLSGLIPTSGSHIVLRRLPAFNPGDSQLVTLDLAGGEAYDLTAPANLQGAFASTDGEVIMAAGPGYTEGGTLQLARVLDSGITRAKDVGGATRPAGMLSVAGWTEDDRFVVFYRADAVSHGGVVVDTWANATVATIGGPGWDQGAYFRVSAYGAWLAFEDLEGARYGIARITSAGLEVLDLPGINALPIFSPFDERAVYWASDENGETRLFDTRLQGKPTDITPDGLPAFAQAVRFVRDNDHVLFRIGATSETAHNATLDLRTRELSTNLEHFGSSPIVVSADASSGAILHAVEDQRVELLLTDFVSDAPVLVQSVHSRPELVEVNTIGAKHFWLYGDESVIHVVGLAVSADGVGVYANDSDEGLWPGSCSEPFTAQRMVMGAHMKDALGLFDVSDVDPVRVGMITPENGGELRCPVWNEGGNRFAYVEHSADENRSYVYTVRWETPSKPSVPELVYELEGGAELVSYRP